MYYDAGDFISTGRECVCVLSARHLNEPERCYSLPFNRQFERSSVAMNDWSNVDTIKDSQAASLDHLGR